MFLQRCIFCIRRRAVGNRNKSSSSPTILPCLWTQFSRTESSLPFLRLSDNPPIMPAIEQGGTYFQTPIFTYKELDEATNHFDSKKKLRDGRSGSVYQGMLRDGRVVAIKRLFEHNNKHVEQFMNEIVVLSRLRHQNLVSLYGCTNRHSRELLLVYEYVPNGTLADHLHGNRASHACLTWPVRLSIAREIAVALTYLHEDVIHQNLTTDNILLDNSFHVKVAGFGFSRVFSTVDVNDIFTFPQGTPGYFQRHDLNDKNDVYSFGVVLIEIISSKHPHEMNLANMAVNRIRNRELHELVDPALEFDTNYSRQKRITMVAELAFRCLQQEKDLRPCMMEVLETLRGI